MSDVTWLDLFVWAVLATCIVKLRWDLNKATKEIERLKWRDE